MSVFHPGIGAPALADHGADMRAGDDIDPGRRGALTRFEGDHVFAPIGGEAPQTVAENTLAGQQGLDLLRRWLLHGLQTVRHPLWRHPAFHWLDQGCGDVSVHHPGDRLQQHPFVLGQFLVAPHEDPARLVQHLRFGARVDQPHDLVMQLRPVARKILVDDHQVGSQALHPPIGVSLQHLFDQVDPAQVADIEQDNRQVAGDGKTPQPRLAQLIAGNDARRGAAQGIAEDDRGRQAAIDLGLGFGDPQVAQHLLTLEPGHFKGALDEVPIAIFLQQRQGGFTGVRDSGDDLHGRRFVGFQGQGAADRHDGIEHRTIRVRQPRTAITAVDGHRVSRGSPAPDEFGAIRLVRGLVAHRARRGQQVKHPWHLLSRRAATARAEDRLPLGEDFGLHEQVAEGAMGQVGIERGQHHLGVAGQLDMAGPGRLVGERDPADFHIVLGGDTDFGVGIDRLVAPPVFGTPLDEDRLIVLGLAQGRLIGGGPIAPRVAVAQVNKGSPTIAGGILAPAGDGQVAPAAVAAAGMGCHDVVAAVGQQMNFRGRRVRVGKDAHDPAGLFDRMRGGAHFGCVGVHRRPLLRHPFLQQQLGRL